jgi:colanic acid biosynthesis glycosyl transferase WcaI
LSGQPRCLWFVSELYYPEQTSTGYYVTGIAEGLARHWPVAVLCAQPTYAARGTRAPEHETRNGVLIWRCWGTTFDKDRLLFRVLNLATISLSIFGNALRRFRRGDIVVVTTNPPTLPFIALVACRLRGAHCVLLVHDLYPDVFVAAGWFRVESFIVSALRALQRLLYQGMARIVVLGRDAQELIVRQLATGSDRVVRITNWADGDDVRPMPRATNALLMKLGLVDRFVVQYSGNMGRTHGLEHLLGAAERLRADPEIQMLFIGNGAKRDWLERAAIERELTNVRILPFQPREQLAVSLGACDVAIVSFAHGMAGVSVPSRMYNIMASGRPIIAVADATSELARVVQEEKIGWVIPPGSAEGIAATIRQAKENERDRIAMGAQARLAATERYSYGGVISAYYAALSQIVEKET